MVDGAGLGRLKLLSNRRCSRDEAVPNGWEVGANRGVAGIGGTGKGRARGGFTVACIRAREEAVGARRVDDLVRPGAVEWDGLRWL